MPEICQTTLPIKPWMEEKTRRLPGLQPIAPGDWLQVDEAYGAQMAYREALLRDRRAQVFRQSDAAGDAAGELLERVLVELAGHAGFRVEADQVHCLDGRSVTIDRAAPLITAARLVQEDLVLMQKVDGEHVLSAAVLCFPASWSLDEKYGGSLMGIHQPVDEYDADIGRRVQRLFDFIKPELPMWRANFLTYADPDLHQPRREDSRRLKDAQSADWLRVERQSLVKLPQTGAVVFSIHTYVVPVASLSAAEHAELLAQS